jgi:hypothetical protein
MVDLSSKQNYVLQKEIEQRIKSKHEA